MKKIKWKITEKRKRERKGENERDMRRYEGKEVE